MRDQFLLDPATVFLNHGSFGACPRPVFAELQRWQLELERNPVLFLGRRSAELLLHARERLAAYVGARAQDLVFMPNATTAVNLVARSLDLRAGDEILATDHEYGACDAAWRFVCDRAGARYRRVAIPLPFDRRQWADRLINELKPSTKLLFVSHITSTTALIFPVAELCSRAQAAGVPVLIDGAHAPGHVPFDGPLDLQTLGAAYYTGNCHKWLCAPKGAAFLHVQPGEQAALHASVVSWGYVAEGGGHTGFDAYTGSTPLERRLQWQGTRDIAAFLSVPAAIDFQASHDWPRWRERCHTLACITRDRVLARNGLAPVAPDSAHGQMVLIPVRCPSPEAAEALRADLFERHHIEVPVTQHGGHTFVRLSVQAYNTEADLDALVSALAEARV